MAGEILKLGGASFHPSAANTGNENATLLRGKNMMLRGSDGSFYFEAYGGHKNLNEPIPMIQMSGTISYTNGSLNIVGDGTEFRTELRFGQKFLAGNPLQVFVVEDIIDNTHVRVQRAPDANGSNQPAYKPAHLFEIHNQRGTLVWGNAVKSDRGNIIAVGEGRLRLNGELLAGESLDATRRLQLAIFDPVTEQYSVGPMGFDTAPPANGVSVTVVTGGTKDMTQGLYSFRWMWADSTTGYGFSNPSEVIKLDASANPIEITATGQRFRLDFTTGLPSKPSNADAIIVLRSLYADPAQNAAQAAEGSWFVASTVRIDDLEAGDILHVDVLDGELGTEITFDNDAPPDSDWVSFLAGDPILISCYGDKVVGGSDRGSSPGPFVSLGRRGNRHGFPAANATVLSPPDTIIGFLPAVGRLFLLTRVGLPFAAATGQADFPVETRAFWQTGFKSPYGLVFVNDTLYAFTHKGPTKSQATGDVGGEQFAFAGAVDEITRTWHAGYVHAVHDPVNELIVLIYSASHRNEEGFWVSLALPYYLKYGIFGPLIEISKPGRDMIVTGAATVGGKLQFLAGGRGNIEEIPSEEESSEEDLSSEESSEEDIEFDSLLGNVMCCTGACGVNVHTSSTSGISVETSDTREGGSHAIRFDATVTPQLLSIFGLSVTGHSSVSSRLYVKFDTLPNADAKFYASQSQATFFPNVTGIGYHHASGTLRLYSTSTLTGITTFKSSGSGVIEADRWYRIDIKWTWTGASHDTHAQVDDLELAPVLGTPNSTGLYTPALTLSSGNMLVADLVLTDDYRNYPIGPGHVRRWTPNADGNHNITAVGDFKVGAAGASIADSDSNTHLLIDDSPLPVRNTAPSGSDFITQVADTPGGGLQYVEHTFDTPDAYEPLTGPRIVQYVGVRHGIGGGSSNSKIKLVDNTTEGQITLPTNAVGTNYTEIHQAHKTSLATGGQWTLSGGDGNFLNLRHRYGFASGVHDPALDGFLIEAEFPRLEDEPQD